jgi:hypothetical protein
LASSYSNAQTYKTIGDDGYANVPLGFSFPYYDQTFNNSWMYDNGVVSFKQPGTQGALSPYQWSAQPLSQSNGTYFIAPLWADMAPVAATKYIVQGDATYQKYTWSNIAEYYSAWGGSPRLNTFSLQIKPDGSYNSTYSQINLQTSNIGVGSVGGPGQYTQIGYYPYGTQATTNLIKDWSFTPPPPPPPPVADPCVTNPLSSPSCSGYGAAYVLANSTKTTTAPIVTDTSYVAPTVDSVVTTNVTAPTSTGVALLGPTTTTPVQTTSSGTTDSTTTLAPPPAATTTSAPSVGTATTSAAPSATNPQPIIGSVQQAGSTKSTSSSSSSGTGASMSLIMSTIKSEQSRVSAVETTTIQNAVGQATSASSQAVSQAEATAATLTANSISNSNGGSTSSSTTQASKTGSFGLNAFNPAAIVASSSAIMSSSRQQTLENSATFSNQNEARGVDSRASLSQQLQRQVEMDVPKYEGLKMGIRSPLNDAMQNNMAIQMQEANQPQSLVVNKNVKDNELASGGITIASMATTPVGYNSYNLAMRDVAFYSPKEIYKNQQTVDNKSASRRLFGGSDIKFDEMVQEQYKVRN